MPRGLVSRAHLSDCGPSDFLRTKVVVRNGFFLASMKHSQ